jgi:hypothetical protein
LPKRSASSLLERALAALSAGLERAGAPYMIIGGVAVIAYGVKRLTTDADAVVQGNAFDVKALSTSRSVLRASSSKRSRRAEWSVSVACKPRWQDRKI